MLGRLSIKDTFMGSTSDGCDGAVMQLTEFVAGYASAATRAAYRSDLSLWLAHCQGQGRGLFEVRRADIEGYARRLEADGLAPATVNRRLATITGFYRWALDEGLVVGNPAGNVRRSRPAQAWRVPS
jgi:integrase/recombinase XerD